MAEPESEVDQLFEKLDKAISSGQHERAVKAADGSTSPPLRVRLCVAPVAPEPCQ